MLDFVTALLSRLLLGRAEAMMGDEQAARKSYHDFLTLWKDADPEIPIDRQAKGKVRKAAIVQSQKSPWREFYLAV